MCPAALAIQPPNDAPSVVCGVLELSNHGAHVNGYQDKGHVSPVLSGTQDRLTVHGFCAGKGLPGSRCSYTACAVWRAAREADWASRKGPDALRDPDSDRQGFLDPEHADALRAGEHLTSGERQEILAMRA